MNQNQIPNAAAIGMNDIIGIRLGLAQIPYDERSQSIHDALAHLDKVIAALCLGFQIPTPPPAPRSPIITSFDPDQPTN